MDPLLTKIIAAIETHPKLQYESAKKFYRESIRRSVHFTETLVPDGSVPVGGSKVSGQPDLPAGAKWPVYNNIPMHFIAQFNCVDIFKAHNYSLLPPTGLLSIFVYENEEKFQPGSEGVKVIYTPADKILERRMVSTEVPIAECAALTFHKTYSLPEMYHTSRMAVKEWTNIVTEVDTIIQSFYKEVHAYNYFMGYPREYNGTVMDYFWAIQSLGIKDWDEADGRKLDIADEMLDFTTLLHHDFCCSKTSIKKLGGGVAAAFGVRTEDLDRLDFSKVFMTARS